MESSSTGVTDLFAICGYAAVAAEVVCAAIAGVVAKNQVPAEIIGAPSLRETSRAGVAYVLKAGCGEAASVADLERAAADRRAAGVGVAIGENEDSAADLGQTAGTIHGAGVGRVDIVVAHAESHGRRSGIGQGQIAGTGQSSKRCGGQRSEAQGSAAAGIERAVLQGERTAQGERAAADQGVTAVGIGCGQGHVPLPILVRPPVLLLARSEANVTFTPFVSIEIGPRWR